LEDLSDDRIQTPMFFPTIDIQPIASAYIRAMTELNIWGQITMMRQNIEKRRTHLVGLASTILKEITELEKVEMELKDDKKKLEIALQYYKQVEETLRNKQKEIGGLRRNVDELRQHPGVTVKSSGTSVLHRGGATPLPSHSFKSQSRLISQECETTEGLHQKLSNLKSRPRRKFEIGESDDSSDDSIPDTSGAGKTQNEDNSQGNNEMEEKMDVEVNEN
jgi:hypothetical protein